MLKKYFIGKSLPHQWASVYNYRPVDPVMLDAKGEIFAVLTLLAPKEFNAMTAGNLLVDRFHEAYFESKKEGVTACLIDAVEHTRDRLAELLKKEEEIAGKGVEFDLAAVVVRNDEVYFATFGGHKIFLLTNKSSEKVVDISASLRDPYGKGHTKVGSSFLQKDQRFLLATETAAIELKGEGDKKSDNEILLALKGLNDLRFKNLDYKKPEQVAVMMFGIDVDESEEEEVVLDETNMEAEMEGRNDLMDESDIPSDMTMEEFAEVQNAGDLDGDHLDQPPVHLLGDTGQQEQYDENDHSDEEYSDVESEEEDEELTPSDWREKMKLYLALGKEKGRQVASVTKRKVENYRKQRELSHLQSMRETGGHEGNVYDHLHNGRRASLDSEELENVSTINAIFMRLKFQLGRYKDIVLYDLLQVNQKGRYSLRRESLTFRILVVFAIFILILFSYLLIRSFLGGRARAAEVDRAKDKLLLISKDIDELESSPVLNSRSTGDIDQRQALLSEISKIEEDFDSELDVLPEEDVQEERSRLNDLRKQTLKQSEPNLDILVDIANLFEGSITDFVQVDKNLYILDGENGKLYRQPTSGGNPELVVEGLSSPTSISSDANGDLVVYEAGSDNVITIVNPVTKEKRSIPGISKDKLPEAKAIGVYAQTNGLYSISKGISTVYVSNKSGESYTLPQIRYTNDQLTDMRDLEIVDGRIFVLANKVGIDRVGLDDERIVAFEDVISSVKSADAMGYDKENIYVVDNKSKRIIVLTKNRESLAISDMVAQLQMSKISEDMVEVASDSDQGLVFVATKTKIYTFSNSSF